MLTGVYEFKRAREKASSQLSVGVICEYNYVLVGDEHGWLLPAAPARQKICFKKIIYSSIGHLNVNVDIFVNAASIQTNKQTKMRRF